MGERVHPTEIAGHKLADLAVQVGRLRYDALAVFVQELANELERQSVADAARHRRDLACRLDSAHEDLESACHEIKRAFKIASRHMQDELAVTPSLLPKDGASS